MIKQAPICPACGSQAWQVLFAARDRMHQLPGDFFVAACRCGMAVTLPQPADPGSYYPDHYYAYQAPGEPPLPHGIVNMLVSLLLRDRYGYAAAARVRGLPRSRLLAGLAGLAEPLVRRRAAAALGPGPLPPFVPGGRALDIGCGSGNWLVKARSLGWAVQGVEPSAPACAAARAAGLDVFEGDLLQAQLPSASFDLVRIWHALEHTPDPLAVLREMSRLLKPNGMILIGVPNRAGLLARWFGRFWFDLDVPRHLWHFTPAAIDRLFDRAGLRSERIGYGFYYNYSSLWSLWYLIEQRRGYTPERRAGFQRAWNTFRRAIGFAPLRPILRWIERTNHLEVIATKR
ncbi:MAG: hypothetical protein Fur005_23500 [Roseiflexaceae bacterium]